MSDTNNVIAIRHAGIADIASLFEIRTSVQENHLSMTQLATLGITPKTLPAMLHHPGCGWVAESAGQVVAFSMANAQEAIIFALFVRHGHEGKGIGRQLMAETEAWLFDQGCTQIWLSTDRNPTVRANGFYRHLGWQPAGQLEDGQEKLTRFAPVCARSSA